MAIRASFIFPLAVLALAPAANAKEVPPRPDRSYSEWKGDDLYVRQANGVSGTVKQDGSATNIAASDCPGFSQASPQRTRECRKVPPHGDEYMYEVVYIPLICQKAPLMRRFIVSFTPLDQKCPGDSARQRAELQTTWSEQWYEPPPIERQITVVDTEDPMREPEEKKTETGDGKKPEEKKTAEPPKPPAQTSTQTGTGQTAVSTNVVKPNFLAQPTGSDPNTYVIWVNVNGQTAVAVYKPDGTATWEWPGTPPKKPTAADVGHWQPKAFDDQVQAYKDGIKQAAKDVDPSDLLGGPGKQPDKQQGQPQNPQQNQQPPATGAGANTGAGAPANWMRVQNADGKWFWVDPTSTAVLAAATGTNALGPTNPIGSGWQQFTATDGKAYWIQTTGTTLLPTEAPVKEAGQGSSGPGKASKPVRETKKGKKDTKRSAVATRSGPSRSDRVTADQMRTSTGIAIGVSGGGVSAGGSVGGFGSGTRGGGMSHGSSGMMR